MNSFFKALLGVVLVTIVAGLGIYWQKSVPSAYAEQVSLSAEELNLFADKNLGFREKSQLSGDQAARKAFLEKLSKQLSLVGEAEKRGLGQDPEVKTMVDLGTAQSLQDAYSKKHPDQATGPRGVQATPEETQAWIASHREDLDRYKKAISNPMHGAQGPKDEDIAGIFVIADKAKADGLDKDPETALQIKLNRYGALIQKLVPDLQKEAQYSDDEVKAYYAEHSKTGDLDKVHVQHILFATVPMPTPENPAGGPAPDPEAKRQLAEQVLQRIKNGEDFATLAKQYSDDPGSKDKGGDLGMSERFKFVPQFEDAAWKLQPGQVSDVVKTDFGYHIIKVLERQPAGELTPEMIEDLKDRLTQKRFEEKVDEIAKANPVKLPDDFNVPPPPPQPQMQGLPPELQGAPDMGDEDMEAPPTAPAETPKGAKGAKPAAPKAAPKPAAKAAGKGQ